MKKILNLIIHFFNEINQNTNIKYKKKMLLALVSLLVFSYVNILNSQALPNQYGHLVSHPTNLGCNVPGCNIRNVASSDRSQQYNGMLPIKNLIITKINSLKYQLTLQTNCLNTTIPSDQRMSAHVYIETNNLSLINSNTNYSGVVTTRGFFIRSSIATTNNYSTAQQDLRSCVTNWNNLNNVPTGSTLTNSGCQPRPNTDLFLNRNSQGSMDLKIYDAMSTFYANSSSTVFDMYGINFLKTLKYIVTDPKNWSTYTTQDYDLISNNPTNFTQKITRVAEIYNQGTTLIPQFFINSAPDTNIWNSRITHAQSLYAPFGSSSFTYTGHNSKSGHAWNAIPLINYVGMIRYNYTLDNDPVTTNGTLAGYVEVFYHAGRCTRGTDGTTSNPYNICKSTNLDLKNIILTANNNLIRLPFSELNDNISFTGTGVNASTGVFNASSAGTYTVNAIITYDNATENFPITIKVTESPLVHNSSNFQYGDGSFSGALGNQLNICNGNTNLNNTPLQNIFFTNSTQVFYNTTATTDFTFNLRQNSVIGTIVQNGSGKNNTISWSNLNQGTYYLELMHNKTNNSNICQSVTYYFKIEVLSNPKPSIGIDTSICANTGSLTLNPTITGGTWNTVTGFTNGVVNNAVATGANTIIYSVTHTNNCVNSDTAIVTIRNNPQPSIGVDKSFCSNESPYVITPSITGGIYNTALGLSNDTFRPTISGVGTRNIIYTVNQNNCTNSDTAIYSVSASPIPIQLTQKNFSICNNKGTINLNANVIAPTGVTWSGNGVTGGIFNPSSLLPNTYKVVAQVSTGSCSNTDTVTIVNLQGVSLTSFSGTSLCSTEPNYNLNNLVLVSQRGGKHIDKTSIGGVLQDTMFVPSAGTGNRLMNYIVIASNSCSDTVSYTMTSNPKPAKPTYTRLYDSVCMIPNGSASNLNLVTLYGISPSSNSTGTFTGTNVINGNSININGLNAWSVNHYNYIQTNNNNCKDTTIFSLKALNGSDNQIELITYQDTICHNLSTLNMNTYNKKQIGGNWSYGTNTGAFNPMSNTLILSFLPANTLSTLTYTKDTNGCILKQTMNIFRNKPSVSAGNDRNVCNNDNEVILQGTPTGGVWSIDTIAQNVMVFDPRTLSINQSNDAKQYNLFYTITDNTGCANKDTTIYTIIKKPTITYVKKSDSVCLSNTNINLTDLYLVSPIGGVWNGSNINNGNFVLSSAQGNSNYTQNYIVQNTFGCKDTLVTTLRVDSSNMDNLINSDNFRVCESSTPINLNTFIINKSIRWSINGETIIDTIFYPTQTNAGTKIVEYNAKIGACAIKIPKNMIIVSRPAQPTINGSLKYCDGNHSLNIQNPSNILTYRWMYENDSVVSTSSNRLAKNETIKIKAINDINCESFATSITTEIDKPSGALSSNIDTLENGNPINLSIINSAKVMNAIFNFSDGMATSEGLNVTRNLYNKTGENIEARTITAELISSIGCKTNINKIIYIRKGNIDTSRSSINNKNDKDIVVYPNPFVESISILNGQKSLISIYDIKGKLILSEVLRTNEENINLSHLSSGTYFIRFEDKSFKIIKE